MQRICCNWCGKEDVCNVRWICPLCAMEHPIEPAQPKTFHSYFCEHCHQNFTSVQIIYKNHLQVDKTTQDLWVQECLKEKIKRKGVHQDSKDQKLLTTAEDGTQKDHINQDPQDATQKLTFHLREQQRGSNWSLLFVDSKINVHYRNEHGESILRYTLCRCENKVQDKEHCKHQKLAFWLVSHGVCPYSYSLQSVGRAFSPWPRLIWPFFFIYQREYVYFLVWIRKMARIKKHLNHFLFCDRRSRSLLQ